MTGTTDFQYTPILQAMSHVIIKLPYGADLVCDPGRKLAYCTWDSAMLPMYVQGIASMWTLGSYYKVHRLSVVSEPLVWLRSVRITVAHCPSWICVGKHWTCGFRIIRDLQMAFVDSQCENRCLDAKITWFEKSLAKRVTALSWMFVQNPLLWMFLRSLVDIYNSTSA